eukprot:3281429-Amphidinium_carterae.1
MPFATSVACAVPTFSTLLEWSSSLDIRAFSSSGSLCHGCRSLDKVPVGTNALIIPSTQRPLEADFLLVYVYAEDSR